MNKLLGTIESRICIITDGVTDIFNNALNFHEVNFFQSFGYELCCFRLFLGIQFNLIR